VSAFHTENTPAFMKKIIFILSITAIIFSCKKSETPADTCTVSNTTIIGTYTLTAIKYKASSAAAEDDLFSGLDDCKKDDTYELKTDGSVVVEGGANICGGPPPPGGITNWSLTNSNQTLGLDDEYTISSFDCTTLVLTKNDNLVAGDTKKVTYVKK
jgi:hypothetical protein